MKVGAEIDVVGKAGVMAATQSIPTKKIKRKSISKKVPRPCSVMNSSAHMMAPQTKPRPKAMTTMVVRNVSSVPILAADPVGCRTYISTALRERFGKGSAMENEYG